MTAYEIAVLVPGLLLLGCLAYTFGSGKSPRHVPLARNLIGASMLGIAAIALVKWHMGGEQIDLLLAVGMVACAVWHFLRNTVSHRG